MKKIAATTLSLLAVLQLGLGTTTPAFAADPSTLSAGTRLFLTLDDNVTSARGGDDVGTIVRCRVWRDVESQGVVFIKSGTPATCRVDKVKRRNMGGTEGAVSVGGVETRSTDGQLIMLSGGYNKEGSGHKAVVWTVGLLLLWPVLFVPGGNAELPPGTVFDVSTVNELKIAGTETAPVHRVVNLSSLSSGFSAEFMLDDFLAQPKHSAFRIKVSTDGELPTKLFIDNVNGKPVDAMAMVLSKIVTNPEGSTGVAEINAKVLAKHFVRGINRFEVAYMDGAERKATEVVMEVQM